jgi:hypothetical protein
MFILRGGERIKIGRVVFTVKELVNDKYNYNSSAAAKDAADLDSMVSSVSEYSSKSAMEGLEKNKNSEKSNDTDDGEFNNEHHNFIESDSQEEMKVPH